MKKLICNFLSSSAIALGVFLIGAGLILTAPVLAQSGGTQCTSGGGGYTFCLQKEDGGTMDGCTGDTLGKQCDTPNTCVCVVNPMNQNCLCSASF